MNDPTEASLAFADYLGAPEEARGNDRLVFDKGNQFTRPGQYGMFFAIPTWWRGFIFHLLTPRDFAAYCYICAQTDIFGIAYPTGDHMKIDMGRSHNATIYGAIGRLEKLGFIIKEQRSPILRYNTHRNIYQRPSPEFTLLKLLELELIDGYLKPVQNKNGVDYVKRHGKAIEGALEKLLSPVNFRKYQRAKPSLKAQVLSAGLQERLDERRDATKPDAATPRVPKKRKSAASASTEPKAPASAKERKLKRVPRSKGVAATV